MVVQQFRGRLRVVGSCLCVFLLPYSSPLIDSHQVLMIKESPPTKKLVYWLYIWLDQANQGLGWFEILSNNIMGWSNLQTSNWLVKTCSLVSISLNILKSHCCLGAKNRKIRLGKTFWQHVRVICIGGRKWKRNVGLCCLHPGLDNPIRLGNADKLLICVRVNTTPFARDLN